MTAEPSPVSRTSTPARSLTRPTLEDLWAFLAVALPALAAVIAPLAMVDLAYHLRAGEQILSGGGIPSIDTWTFTIAGREWVDQQWGAQAVLAAVYRLAGWSGLVLLRVVLTAGTFWLLSLAIARGGERAPGGGLARTDRPAGAVESASLGRRPVAWLTLAAFVLAAPSLALRPQLFGFTLLAGILALLADRRAHPSRLWLIPVLAALWANLHGSFVLAPVVVGLAWLDDLQARAPRRHLALAVAAASALATLVNPFGPGVWIYVASLSSNPTIAERVSEWQRTSPLDPAGALFWLSVTLVVVVVGIALVRARGAGGPLADRPFAALPWPTFLALAGFAVLGAWTARGIGWWALVAAVSMARLMPLLASLSREPAVDRSLRPSRLNALLAGAIVLAGVVAFPAWRPVDAGTGAPSGLLSYAPTRITEELRILATERPPSEAPLNVWAPQAWASWFEFAVPRARYAVDSRIELFPAEVWAEADTVAAGWANALALIDRYRVDAVVTRAGTDVDLRNTLAATPSWSCRHGDAEGQVWVRGAGPPGPGC